MSKNTNRDYLIIVNVKTSTVREFNKLEFYINDKESHNIFVQLVIKESHDVINKYVPVDDPNLYELTMNIVKPTNEHKKIIGKLISLEDGLYEFKLPQDCCDKVGTYKCELETKYNSRITNSNNIKYRVKKSVLNDLDGIVDAPGYPLVVQLFDKLSDIEQYEEDRRTNELARQLAEEQRQTRFNALDTDMTDSIQAMDNKVVEVENRITAKEQAVDKLIVDTKADIDEYKVAKDQEIDEYKALKDTEINNAITAQDNKIDTAITSQNDRIAVVESNDAVQDNRLNTVEAKNQQQDGRLDAIEVKNTQQDGRLDVVENRLNNIGNDITNTMQPIIDAHTSRLDTIEAIDVTQNSRLDAIEVKNQEQDDRLLDIEKVNKRQDMNLKCLFAESKNNMIDITEEGNSIYLQNSTTGYTLIDEIKGNTLVNCNKEPDKELILNGNINTSGDNSITITEGVDGGKVDVALEGNTLVNVSKTKDSTAITKAYTVENSGNHIALQGDIDGSCRPVITGNTLVNLFPKIVKTSGVNDITLPYTLKSNTTYTFIADVVLVDDAPKIMFGILDNTYANWSGGNPKEHTTNHIIYTITTDNKPSNKVRLMSKSGVDIVINSFILLEGDYTNKPIPDYFEGLQSSFEDNLVTQEMVDSGEEVADNLGKYRIDYRVTGKNKFDKSSTSTAGILSDAGNMLATNNWRIHDYMSIKPNTIYVLSEDSTNYKQLYVAIYDKNKNFVTRFILEGGSTLTFTTPSNSYFYRLGYSIVVSSNPINRERIQVEEGDTATAYEPYKEYTKTLYLNSPLLEGDTIEEKDNGIYHVHRSELVAYAEGDETSLITDKVNTLHQLSEPQYELIEQSNLVIPSYVNGHLDFNTAIPIEKVEFKAFSEELTYLYANTQYTVQFVADKATTIDITLGGTQLLAQSIVAGFNRITITTPETLVDNKLIIDGVGASISNVVVTDTDREFKYFEGMKSVGEGGTLEITSANSDNTLSNTHQLTHEPLRAVGEVKDRYTLIDGKWYIERKCGEIILDETRDWIDGGYGGLTNGDTKLFQFFVGGNTYTNELINIISDSFIPLSASTCWSTDIECIALNSVGLLQLRIKTSRLTEESVNGLKAWLTSNNIKCVYKLATLQYEPIDYNPFEVYSDITHISTNSVIPTNIIVKNHGYNCLLKPNTTYTISSSLGLNTVTTGSDIGDSHLRFMDTDTSDVTTMKNVLVLEGDWTTKADLIPANFSGIESAFEQEYDAEKGKYKVNAKVANEDKTKENNITFYIDEPLRGVRDAKDKVYVKDDKVVVERKCGVRAYEDGDFGTYITDKIDTVYPLAEPVYEEVEYNDTKLFIESFKNSTLFYNSNVPVTSKVHYSYSVPIVDTVAQTASISDEQDVMIIDLATQVAVMEMMLM